MGGHTRQAQQTRCGSSGRAIEKNGTRRKFAGCLVCQKGYTLRICCKNLPKFRSLSVHA